MYKHCATEESARRQRQLETCLQDLMITENYPQITISDICSRAGISRKSFYRYFSSKEGCLYALLDHAIFDGASYYLPDHGNTQSVHFIYERFFTYWQSKAPLLDALDRNTLGQLLAERMLAYIVHEEHDLRYFLRDQEDTASERCIFYIAGLMGLILSWHKTGFSKTPAQMAKLLSDMIA